jgi:hypothetical protein
MVTEFSTFPPDNSGEHTACPPWWWRFQRANAKRRNADIIPAKHILFVMPRMFAVEAAVSAAISAFWYSQSEIFFVLSLKKRVGSLREDLIFV